MIKEGHRDNTPVGAMTLCMRCDSVCISRDSVFNISSLVLYNFVLRRPAYAPLCHAFCVTTGSSYHFTMLIAITIEQVFYVQTANSDL